MSRFKYHKIKSNSLHWFKSCKDASYIWKETIRLRCQSDRHWDKNLETRRDACANTLKRHLPNELGWGTINFAWLNKSFSKEFAFHQERDVGSKWFMFWLISGNWCYHCSLCVIDANWEFYIAPLGINTSFHCNLCSSICCHR